jgi:putative ATP-binding cassette transporter
MTSLPHDLQTKWRQWLTAEMLQRWLSEQHYYRLAITDEQQMNPEYRIAEDMRLASEPGRFRNRILSMPCFLPLHSSEFCFVGGSLRFTFRPVHLIPDTSQSRVLFMPHYLFFTNLRR